MITWAWKNAAQQVKRTEETFIYHDVSRWRRKTLTWILNAPTRNKGVHYTVRDEMARGGLGATWSVDRKRKRKSRRTEWSGVGAADGTCGVLMCIDLWSCGGRESGRLAGCGRQMCRQRNIARALTSLSSCIVKLHLY